MRIADHAGLERMPPIDRARLVWESWSPEGSFEELIANYLRTGFVYCGDDAFILAVPVGQVWFIHLAAGDITRFQQLAPFHLPMIAWQRGGGGRVRMYLWEQFERLTRKRTNSNGHQRFNSSGSEHGSGGPGLTAGSDRPRSGCLQAAGDVRPAVRSSERQVPAHCAAG